MKIQAHMPQVLLFPVGPMANSWVYSIRFCVEMNHIINHMITANEEINVKMFQIFALAAGQLTPKHSIILPDF